MTQRSPAAGLRTPTIFMMDLWATVPYYTAYLSRALLEQGANVIVGSITYYLDPTCFSSRGIRVDPGLLDVVGKFNLPQGPRRALKLLEALLNMFALAIRFLFSPPDIVHVQYLPMLRWRVPIDAWFLRLCQRRGSKIALTVHDLLPHDTADAYKQTFQQLYSEVDGIICHSDHVRQRLGMDFGVPSDKISVIPHGPFFYDLPVTTPAQTTSLSVIDPNQTDNPVTVLWQGIIFPYKGLDLLLTAWKSVEAKVSNARLVVAGTGSGDLLASLRQQVLDLDLKRVELNLRFISAEELVAAYRNASIVVYPYRAITTSGALATGLALGKTIVASDLPVFRELLRHRENAMLVDPQNTDELAATLVELTQKPELRQSLSDQVTALDFGNRSWLSIAEKTLQTYATLL